MAKRTPPDKPVSHMVTIPDRPTRADQFQGEILEAFKTQAERLYDLSGGEGRKADHFTGLAFELSAYGHSKRDSIRDTKLPSISVDEEKRNLDFRIQEVIGSDDRVEVVTTTDYPFGCICSLRIEPKQGPNIVGTGWLINPTTVITAGHCVYVHGQKGWVNSIEVMPSRKGNAVPFVRTARQLLSVDGWTARKQAAFDYGAIKLNEPCPVPGSIGYLVASERDLRSYNCHVVGYPDDRFGTMWGHIRRLASVKPRQLFYDIDTSPGQSGAPVFIVLGSKVYGIGVHNYGNSYQNTATRITNEVYDNFERWKTI